VHDAVPVGAGLARDGAGTFNMDAGRPNAFAGNPAPTVDLWHIWLATAPDSAFKFPRFF
jgi:hypothetical protein